MRWQFGPWPPTTQIHTINTAKLFSDPMDPLNLLKPVEPKTTVVMRPVEKESWVLQWLGEKGMLEKNRPEKKV
jgi:hypothetical protein